MYKNKNVCVHLDYLQNPFSRGIKIIGKEGILSWSYENKFVEVIKDKPTEKKFPENIIKILCI